MWMIKLSIFFTWLRPGWSRELQELDTHDPDLIVQHFNNLVDLIIDGGILHSEPSTVIDLTGEEPEILRQGAGATTLLVR